MFAALQPQLGVSESSIFSQIAWLTEEIKSVINSLHLREWENINTDKKAGLT